MFPVCVFDSVVKGWVRASFRNLVFFVFMLFNLLPFVCCWVLGWLFWFSLFFNFLFVFLDLVVKGWAWTNLLCV